MNVLPLPLIATGVVLEVDLLDVELDDVVRVQSRRTCSS